MTHAKTAWWARPSALLVVLGFAGVLLVVIALGPRPHIDPTLPKVMRLAEPKPVGDDPDGSRAQAARADLAEQAVQQWDSAVRERLRSAGCQTRLRWNHADRRRTAVSLVYVHGFSACPQDLHPVLDRIADTLGANLVQIRLTGHGLSDSGLDGATGDDWLTDVAKGRGVGLLVGEETILVGMSTGATLVALSAAASSDGLKGLALLSPNFRVKNQAAAWLSLPWGVALGSWITGSSRHTWKAESDLRQALWTTDYHLSVVSQMQAVVDAGRRMDFGSLTLPVLMVVSRHDEVVDVKAAEDVFGRIASAQKKFEVLPGSNRHELAGHAIDDALVAPLAELVSSFFAGMSSGR